MREILKITVNVAVETNNKITDKEINDFKKQMEFSFADTDDFQVMSERINPMIEVVDSSREPSDLDIFFDYVKDNMLDGTHLEMRDGGYYLYKEDFLLGKYDKNGLKIYYTKEK